jgi:hypothetical protein
MKRLVISLGFRVPCFLKTFPTNGKGFTTEGTKNTERTTRPSSGEVEEFCKLEDCQLFGACVSK